MSGFVVDVVLAPGNCNDTRLLANYLDECVEEGRSLAGQTWVMDKGFRNQALVVWAKERLGLELLPRQQERGGEPPTFWQELLDQVRKPIEGAISVLAECFGIERMRVKTDWGVYRRVQAKATACCLASYFNRVLDRAPMDFAQYAV